MKKYVKLLLIPVLLSGCGLSEDGKKIALNDAIVTANDNISDAMDDYATAMETAIKTQNYTSLKSERIKTVQLINSEIEKISKLEDIGGSEAFRKCELEFLDLEKKCMEDGFSRLESFNAETPMEEVSRVMDDVQKMSSSEDSYTSRINLLQLQYAKKNHLKLESEK